MSPPPPSKDATGAGLAAGTRLTIRLPDDYHHHCRDGAATAAVLTHAAPRLARCLIMPNLRPPVTTTALALEYKARILQSMPKDRSYPYFEPLMTLYLTDKTSPEEIKKAAAAGIVGCKYYPAGATTNSDFGVTNVKNCYAALQEMSNQGMMLCIHSEVTHGDIFEREPAFIQEIMVPLVKDFPKLKITMEHISTKEAVDYVLSAPDNVKASITSHHLLHNRNDLLVGGIRPHLYCLPILKAEVPHRVSLVKAACSGSPKFFWGTDSAPHATDTKEAPCGCAGVFTAHAGLELVAEAMEGFLTANDATNDDVTTTQRLTTLLENFCSRYGAEHYGLPLLDKEIAKVTLEKKVWRVPESYDFGNGKTVTPLRAGQDVQWSIVE